MRLLLAEDDQSLGSAVQKTLGRAGFAVDWVTCGRHFTDSVHDQRYDFVVMDLGLPDDTGEALLQRFRCKHPGVPVVIMTARGGVHDKVAMLDFGADDYLVKPFDLDELTARIRAILRRASTDGTDADALSHGPLRLYPQRHAASWNGEPVSLTQREFWVLEALVRRKNHVLTRSQLEESLYRWGEEVQSNAIEVYIHFLRRKFEPSLIQTVRGVGYQLSPCRLAS